MTNFATLDFVYNGQHLNKTTLDFSQSILFVHSKKKSFESSEKVKTQKQKGCACFFNLKPSFVKIFIRLVYKIIPCHYVSVILNKTKVACLLRKT